MNSVMKVWSVIGLLFAAVIFATIPISPQLTPRGVELSVDQAQAQTYGRYRRYYRRAYRRGYYGGYGYYGRPYGYYGGYGAYGAYGGQPVGGGGGQWYCSVYDPRCWY